MIFKCNQLCRFRRINMRNFVDAKKCYSETKHKKLRDDELDFEEVLNKEIHKRK